VWRPELPMILIDWPVLANNTYQYVSQGYKTARGLDTKKPSRYAFCLPPPEGERLPWDGPATKKRPGFLPGLQGDSRLAQLASSRTATSWAHLALLADSEQDYYSHPIMRGSQ